MNYEIFAICDAATSDSGGKLNILGSFDTITAKTLPVRHPALSVVVRLRLSENDVGGEHKLRIELVPKPLNSLHPSPNLLAEGTFVNPKMGEDATGSVNIIVNVVNLEFKEYGQSIVKLFVDDKQLATLPIFLKRFPGSEEE